MTGGCSFGSAERQSMFIKGVLSESELFLVDCVHQHPQSFSPILPGFDISFGDIRQYV